MGSYTRQLRRTHYFVQDVRFLCLPTTKRRHERSFFSRRLCKVLTLGNVHDVVIWKLTSCCGYKVRSVKRTKSARIRGFVRLYMLSIHQLSPFVKYVSECERLCLTSSVTDSTRIYILVYTSTYIIHTHCNTGNMLK